MQDNNKNKDKKNITLETIASFFEKVAEKSPSVYWLSSPDLSKILYISPAYETIWGRSRKILYDNPELWITYLHPDDLKTYHPIIAMAERIIKFGADARYEENYRIIRPDGECRWILDRGFPIYDEQGNCAGVTGVAVDITKEKTAESLLLYAKERAEESDRVKTAFIENMKHDIRTPLAGIIGFAELIKSENTNPNLDVYVDHLVTSSNMLLNLINEVLEEMNLASGQLPILQKKFNLKEKLESIAALVTPKAIQKNISFALEYDETIPPYLIGDPKRIHRIVLELTTNALKFTDAGKIIISAKLNKQNGHEIVLELTVSDTGKGISSDQKEDIYLRFKRLTPSYEGIYKGTGLGLTIAKKFIDDIKAEIYVDSEVGEGTTFTCLIPLRSSLTDNNFGIGNTPDYIAPKFKEFLSSVPSMQPALSPSEQSRQQVIEPLSISILLVEDNELAAMAVNNLLTKLNYKVDIVQNGQSAILSAQQKNYDFILLDIGLPDIKGCEVAKQIRLFNKTVLIFAVTAHVDAQTEKECLDAGINAVCTKPLVKEKILELVNQVLLEK